MPSPHGVRAAKPADGNAAQTDLSGRSKWAARSQAVKEALEKERLHGASNSRSAELLDDNRAPATENPPWLSSQKPELQHEQAVAYFFAHAPAASSKGQPLRFHMNSGRTYVYSTIISQDLKSNPGSRYVVFVPDQSSVKQAAAEIRSFELKVACVGDGDVFLEDDTHVFVCSYESASQLNGHRFRIKVVEEANAAKMKQVRQVYESQVRRGIIAELMVHFAVLDPNRPRPSRGSSNARKGDGDSANTNDSENGWLSWIARPYNMMWKAIIRPPRASYAERDLGINTFVFGNHVYERQDMELKNSQGHNLICSHFYMRGGQALRQLCVIYLHGNCSSRLEVFHVLPALLARGLSVFCLDLGGSGMSGGEYISLGYHEEKDVSVALAHLRSSGTASAIGLWGRSMGAAAAVLRASDDHELAACVLDSPFSDLRVVVEEYVSRMNLHIPNFVLSTCLTKIRSEISERANFDPFDLVPVSSAPRAKCPALFAVAHDDTFILPHHTFDLHNAWGGERLLSQFTGGHSGRRPSWFLDEASDFLLNRLSAFSSKRRSSTEKRLGQPTEISAESTLRQGPTSRSTESASTKSQHRRVFAL
eukprot:TRINITY_DN21392_c0_g1_i3.p1 TRINITY_DN21392_c0_g1~~TRINITY_DN21392_c0_g1_i3.p1  ORF type:complete len:593 (+),score=86.99 TRINITY_DN21392_c0_g1_i3:119-1897(+)